MDFYKQVAPMERILHRPFFVFVTLSDSEGPMRALGRGIDASLSLSMTKYPFCIVIPLVAVIAMNFSRRE